MTQFPQFRREATRRRPLRTLAAASAMVFAAAAGLQAQETQPREGEDMSATPAAKPKHTNRLVHATSPYLLQHAHNPVDWYPWGEEALERARKEDKPIFLSIGYSACHWCHVMEHESFENEEIAAILNEHFISIKVDREERPDLDEIYMTATQIMTGGGGWPMSVFLTPDLKPFFCGTYFPPSDRMGRPGFKTILNSVIHVWNERRADVHKSADQLTAYIREHTEAAREPGDALTPQLIANATAKLAETYDPTHGGFGGAPKFPSPPAIALLLRQYHHTGEKRLLEMAVHTLRKMHQGGLYDHLGGGFHRYSVDARWLVPHFEKMLYDNAQLSQAYLEAFQATGDPTFARVARETLDYVLRDMRDEHGAFHSTEDADSEGQEGKFYIWTQDEIMSLLGDADGYLFCQYYNVRPGGNFDSHEAYHDKQNILHVVQPLEAAAKELSLPLEAFEVRLAACRKKLFHARAKRVRPGLDDKILASWNGLMISALAHGHQVLDDPRYRESAERAAEFVLSRMMKDGVLLRTHRNGESRIPAFLDDYAFLSVALIDLYETTFDPKWLEEADRLSRAMIERFWDQNAGGFYFTADGQADLLTRTKPMYDGAEPSGNSMAAFALLRLAKLTGNTEYAQKARRVLELNQRDMESLPRGFLKLLCVLDFHLSAPKEIAFVGDPQSAPLRAMLRALHARFVPNKVIAVLNPSSERASELETQIPLLAAKTLVDGKPAVYVCKDYACRQPVTTPEEFIGVLGADPREG